MPRTNGISHARNNISSTGSYDVAVLGGGPAGLAASIALARDGAEVALFDKPPRSDELERVDTIDARLRPVLAELRIADGLLISTATAPAFSSKWTGSSYRERPSILDPHGPPLHIQRGRFRRALEEAALNAGVTMFSGERVHASLLPTGWAVARAYAVTSACFLIVATGRSALPLSAHVGRRSIDRLVASIGRSRQLDNDCDLRLVIEAAPDGWWYRTPRWDRSYQLVFMTDSDLLKSCARSGRGWFQRSAAQTEIGKGFAVDDAVRVAAADSYYREAVVGDELIVIGDAAVATDPLAGQGVTWAITSGLRAAQIVRTSNPRSGLAEYSEEVRHRFAEFLAGRVVTYSQVSLWPNSHFWKRRGPGVRANSTHSDGLVDAWPCKQFSCITP